MTRFKAFLQRKDIVISARRYGIDALSAMAQGLFCSLLIGTILNTLGTQCHIGFLSAAVATVNGTEYTILSAVLSLPAHLQQLLQSFDFTRRNPKIVCIHSGESQAVLEDAIQLTFLSLVGFDVVIFAPTGYQAVEPFLAGRLPVPHEVGSYHFDYTVPDFSALPKKGLLNALKRKLWGN